MYTPDDMVQVTLDPDSPLQPLTVKWNSRKWTLEPGQAKLIPAACANLWFGDPRAGSKVQAFKDDQGKVDGFIPARKTEVRRLRVKYGCLYGDEANFDNATRVDPTTGKVTGLLPKATVATLDGEIVPTVLDDPEGTRVTEAKSTVSEQAELVAVIQRQQRQIELLMREAGIRDDGISGSTTEAELPTDDEPVTRTAAKPRTKAGVVNVDE